MVDVGIHHGDVLVVDRAEKIDDRDVIVANLNGCFTCKIIDTKNAMLISASKDHEPVQIMQDDIFQVEGVVTVSFRIHKRTGVSVAVTGA